MSTYIVYNSITGVIRGKFNLSASQRIEEQLQSPDEDYLETDMNLSTQTLDFIDGVPVIVDLPPPPGPTPEQIEDQEARTALSAHAILNATPAQIDNYIDNNVTDLASAREALKLLAKIAILGMQR